ncbi:ubiquitin-like-specific protease 1 [Abrus precatorius]|uniref:Ubiquitin-like-specific protease 1 n=1 Tax=Abrus precatorius TaxID=3816 RepID=A0A8B8MBQ2_ABRPR|nr:ubiquitin-like-specific protease 1 [Abrus precatorius]
MKLVVRSDQAIDTATFQLTSEHWGKEFCDILGKENIIEVIRRHWLSASSINLYIRYLCEAYLHGTMANRFSFISSYEMDEALNPNAHQHIAEMLKRHMGEDHLIFVPYNVGQHWVLVAINTADETIYYMDHLRKQLKIRTHMQNLFNNALVTYRAERGVQPSSTKMSKTKWVTVQCPKQTNNDDCGYYVCLFIGDALHHGQTVIPEHCIGQKASSDRRRCQMDM